jgi:hypothetical protein
VINKTIKKALQLSGTQAAIQLAQTLTAEDITELQELIEILRQVKSSLDFEADIKLQLAFKLQFLHETLAFAVTPSREPLCHLLRMNAQKQFSEPFPGIDVLRSNFNK